MLCCILPIAVTMLCDQWLESHCSPHSSPSRQCARTSSTGASCSITATCRPACGGPSSPRDRIFGSRFRGDGRRVFDERSIRGPRFGIAISTATALCCSGRLLTKTSSRHRLSLVGLVHPQQPLYAALVSVRLIQATVRRILEIPFSASVCLALRKESETGACTQSNVSTSVSERKSYKVYIPLKNPRKMHSYSAHRGNWQNFH